MEVGMRALKQNPTAAVQAAAAGERVVVTVRNRPTAQLLPIAGSPLTELRAAGLVREARRSVADLPEPFVGLELAASLGETSASDRT